MYADCGLNKSNHFYQPIFFSSWLYWKMSMSPFWMEKVLGMINLSDIHQDFETRMISPKCQKNSRKNHSTQQ